MRASYNVLFVPPYQAQILFSKCEYVDNCSTTDNTGTIKTYKGDKSSLFKKYGMN